MWWVVVIGLVGDVPTSESMRQALARVYEDEALQREWPGEREAVSRPSSDATPPTPPTAPGRSERSGPPPTGRDDPPIPPLRTERPSVNIPEILLWVLGGAGLLFLLFHVVRQWRGARPDVRSPAPDVGPLAPAGTASGAPPLDLADRLAAEGRYDEAVHALLQDALVLLAAQAPLDASLTSREVAHERARDEALHAPFVRIVRAVEVSRFGRRPIDAEEYGRCREHRDRLRELLTGPRPAVARAAS